MKRVPELDGLRGLAAVSVVLYHALPGHAPYGWAGVDLFFVLSGFLITTVIFERLADETFLRDFYRRRIVRVWPVYYLTLLAVLALNAASVHGYATAGLAYHAVFLQNAPEYLGRTPPPFPPSLRHSWSVAIEEQFYLLWPLLVLWFRERRVPHLAVLLLLACTAGTLVWPWSPTLLLTRGQGLALGCVLAWALYGRRDAPPAGTRTVSLALAAAVAVGAAYAAVYAVRFRGSPYVEAITLTAPMLALLFAGMVGLCVLHTGGWWLAPLRSAPLVWLGTISYALYMFHLPLLHYAPELLSRLGVGPPLVRTAATWVLVFALPAASWYGMERPLLNRFRARSAPASGMAHS